MSVLPISTGVPQGSILWPLLSHIYIWIIFPVLMNSSNIYYMPMTAYYLVPSISLLRLLMALIHWGRVTHICVSKLANIGSGNGLSPGRRQAIIWTNAGILLIGPLVTNFSEISIEILTFSFKKMCWKVSSAKWRPLCLGLKVLTIFYRKFMTG